MPPLSPTWSRCTLVPSGLIWKTTRLTSSGFPPSSWRRAGSFGIIATLGLSVQAMKPPPAGAALGVADAAPSGEPVAGGGGAAEEHANEVESSKANAAPRT